MTQFNKGPVYGLTAELRSKVSVTIRTTILPIKLMQLDFCTFLFKKRFICIHQVAHVKLLRISRCINFPRDDLELVFLLWKVCDGKWPRTSEAYE